jgi:hypothetical protein
VFGYDLAQENRKAKLYRVMKIVAAVLVGIGALLLASL